MAKSVYLILILSVFTFSNVKAHEYYVSVCTIDYNMKTKGLELTFKIIAHDVEKSILENEKVDLKLGSEKEAASANEILHQYIDKHFGISIAGAKKELKYVGKEVELDESLYLYFEIENVDQAPILSNEEPGVVAPV